MRECLSFETLHHLVKAWSTEDAVTAHLRVVKFSGIPVLPDLCFSVGQTNLGNPFLLSCNSEFSC